MQKYISDIVRIILSLRSVRGIASEGQFKHFAILRVIDLSIRTLNKGFVYNTLRVSDFIKQSYNTYEWLEDGGWHWGVVLPRR